MNNSTNFFKAVVVMALLALFNVSCSSSDEEAGPTNEITDGDGLVIELEWSTGGSSAQSIEDVDLDMELTLNSTTVEESTNSFSFEQVDINPVYKDGTYKIDVYYYMGSKSVDYSLYVRGASDNGKVLEYSGVFNSSDMGLTISDIEITKSGNKYTIAD